MLLVLQAILDVDSAARANGEAGAGVTQQLVSCYDIFLDLALHPDPPLSVAAAQCQVALLRTHARAAAAALLSTEGAGLAAAVLEGPPERENGGLPRHKTQALMLEAVKMAIDSSAGTFASGIEHSKLLSAMAEVADQGDKSVRLLAHETSNLLKEAMRM